MTTLGNDVIFNEILPRLPAKSLLRFKCVSKSFNFVISSRYFSKLYLRYNHSDLLILPEYGLIKCYDLDSTTATETFIWHHGVPIYVIGSANGVLCIHTPTQLLLLNPTTQICRDIPNVPGYPYGYVLGRFFWFAFDHEINDFKIVRAFENHRNVIRTLVTHVYSLNSNSWEVVDKQVCLDSMQGCYGTLVNKHLLHWIFWVNSLRKFRIGCFDVCKNKWVDDVSLPQYYCHPLIILLDIGVLYKRLFAAFETFGDSYSCNVWLMKEYGVEHSWIKLFNIPIMEGVGKPRVVPLASHVLVGDVLIRRYKTWLSWYNLMDGGRTDAKYDGAPDFSKPRVYMCSRNQVYIPGGKPFGDP